MYLYIYISIDIYGFTFILIYINLYDHTYIYMFMITHDNIYEHVQVFTNRKLDDEMQRTIEAAGDHLCALTNLLNHTGILKKKKS